MRLSMLSIFLILGLLLAGCNGNDSYPVNTYAMGERIDLGTFAYNVYDTQWLTQLGSGPTQRIPAHRFFLVRLSVRNNGHAEATVPTMKIEDENGQTYMELTNGDQVPQWAGFLRSVKPAATLQGNIAFDAPPRHYKLRISDESQQRAALIDLPLTFGSEMPEMDLPQTDAPAGPRPPAR